MNLILCGLKGSGKTTVGAQLAAALQMECIDTDAGIEQAYGLPCRALYKQKGELFFRQAEAAWIASLRGLSHTVISLGGGSLQSEATQQLIPQLGTLIYLACDPKELHLRVGDFPVDTPQRIATYTRLADLWIDTTYLSPEHVVESLLQALSTQGNPMSLRYGK